LGLDRGTHLGQRSWNRVDKAGHMIAIDPPVRFLTFALASKGPSTHDANDDAIGGFRRVEVLTGSARRRRWSADQKARIVAETLEPGARVAEVARRWQLCSQQVFGWRRAARHDVPARSSKMTGSAAPGFVPIVSDLAALATVPRATPEAPVIEVRLAGAVVRVASGADDPAQLTAVLRAVRASASRT
jgi:transposase